MMVSAEQTAATNNTKANATLSRLLIVVSAWSTHLNPRLDVPRRAKFYSCFKTSTRPDRPTRTRPRALKPFRCIDKLKEMHMHVHAGSGAGTSRVLRISLFVTLAYIALLVFAGVRAHSLALLSEAGHNL